MSEIREPRRGEVEPVISPRNEKLKNLGRGSLVSAAQLRRGRVTSRINEEWG